MLPSNLRFWLFDTLSVKTMRYVSAVPTRKAEGLTKKVYDMIREDFFKNGSLTSRSKVPALMAAIWTAGREAMLVEDKVNRTVKDAISAVLSQINDCPYCEDMLVSLVYAGGDYDAASDILAQNDLQATNNEMRERLEWIRTIATAGTHDIPPNPFAAEELPEIFGTLLGMSDINRFSHIVMEDSPVNAPFGLQSVKATALRMFGLELEVTRQLALERGRALPLLPPAKLPEDMQWAKSNPRVADALARYAGAVEREAEGVISDGVRCAVEGSLNDWEGEQMPISRSWVNADIQELDGADRDIAKLAIVLAKAPYQVDEAMAEAVLGKDRDEERFIRILAWASFTGARRFVQLVIERSAAAEAQAKTPTRKANLKQAALLAA